MLDKELLHKKLDLLIGYIGELRPLAVEMSPKEVLGESFKYHTAERLFQLAVDTMIDINIHIIREQALGAPDDLQSTFTVLGSSNVLDKNFSAKAAPMVGLRNRMVHQYDSFSRKQFIEELRKNYPDFEKYMAQITKFIQKAS